MSGLALLEEADVRVRKIRFRAEDTYETVFTAVVLKWRPKLKVWAETNREATCKGLFYNLVKATTSMCLSRSATTPGTGCNIRFTNPAGWSPAQRRRCASFSPPSRVSV